MAAYQLNGISELMPQPRSPRPSSIPDIIVDYAVNLRREIPERSVSDIFSEPAIEEVYRISAGCARVINKICLHSLLYGAQHQRSVIDDSVVQLVAKAELC